MILSALILAATLAQDPPAAAGRIGWERPPIPPAAPPVAAPAPAVAPPTDPLPDWAMADPFGWERAKCSPSTRGDEPLEACQTRVRTELAAHMGDRLPEALRPPSLNECRRTADGYSIDCGPAARTQTAEVRPHEQDCATRMSRDGGGRPVFSSECRPVETTGSSREGLSIRLGGRD